MVPRRSINAATIRRVGEAFIVHEHALEDYVQSVDALTSTTALFEYIRWLLPRCWQINYVRDMTKLGAQLSKERKLDDDQVIKHIAAVFEMPGRWCPFDMSNREFEEQFARTSPEEFQAIRAKLGDAWEPDAQFQARLHWRLGAIDEVDEPCPVSASQIQEELDVYAKQRSPLWMHILRRIFFGGTTMNDFLGMYSEKSRAPVYQRDLFWIARAAVGLVPVADDVDAYGMEARTHGQHFEAMNTSGCLQLLNQGIQDASIKYRHEEVNMVLIPGLEHIFCVSPDGVIIRDDPAVPEAYRRAAFEAKCQYARYTCYETTPDDLYTAQVLGEMVGLGVRHAYASFMFYRVLESRLKNNPYTCADKTRVRATVEILFMSDEVRELFMRLLSAVAYYMQIALHEVIYGMGIASVQGMLADPLVKPTHTLRLELEAVICDLRQQLHELIRVGHTRQGSKGLQRRYIRIRRWAPHLPQHNMVENVKDVTLDLLMEYFDGDEDLYRQWYGKSHLDFCKDRKTPAVRVKVPHSSAQYLAISHSEEIQKGLDAILARFPSRVTKKSLPTVSPTMRVKTKHMTRNMPSKGKSLFEKE